MVRVGLLSDTHGLLRPEAKSFLHGSDLILHAGDVGDPGILEELASLAPVLAVRGNVDNGVWAQRLPVVESVKVGEVQVLLIHDLTELKARRGKSAPHVVVFGHSHQPLIEERGGVLFVNPGSCGPRRFRLPVAVGELMISEGSVSARTVNLVDTLATKAAD